MELYRSFLSLDDHLNEICPRLWFSQWCRGAGSAALGRWSSWGTNRHLQSHCISAVDVAASCCSLLPFHCKCCNRRMEDLPGPGMLCFTIQHLSVGLGGMPFQAQVCNCGNCKWGVRKAQQSSTSFVQRKKMCPFTQPVPKGIAPNS